MKKLLFSAATAALLVSCSTSKTVVKREIPTPTVKKSVDLKTLESNYSGKNSVLVKNILLDAEKYLGAPYKYAGTTSSGFDCSGFTGKVFSENDFQLPRRSADQAATGEKN